MATGRQGPSRTSRQRSSRPGQRDRGQNTYFTQRAANLGGEQVEGHRAVLELLKAGRRRPQEIWFEDGIDRLGLPREIADLALSERVPVVTVSRTRFDSRAASESHQGVMAFAPAIRGVSLEELVKKSGRPPALVVVDHITDPRNFGALLRSAEVAGMTGVVVPEHRACRLTPSATKTAAGAIEYMDFALVPGVPAALEELKALGVWSVGLDPDAEMSLSDVSLLSGPVAMVLGAEGKGLSKLTRSRCDLLAGIPQYGKVESLNVSAAATVAFYEVARSRDEI
ncbi:MAG: 23S rRNA (guanosine(2251)-2'-O)-methyltransferase RlmB [Acidimicrobiaceae bacterium]|nr:23S rRNA (guanosine(2251)-2'-O)-methyltransferase RlmB [Acidimicrobiaceae bacterium]